MAKVALYNMEGAKTGDMEVSDAIFAAEVNKSVLHQVVVNYLANQRQGTQSTKTRTEVRGGGIKPWRQKGTGRASSDRQSLYPLKYRLRLLCLRLRKCQP